MKKHPPRQQNWLPSTLFSPWKHKIGGIFVKDVKTIFLNGDLKEKVFMSQPEGFVVKGEDQGMQTCQILVGPQTSTMSMV